MRKFLKPAQPGAVVRRPDGRPLPDSGGYWPHDSFTARRIADADVVDADANSPQTGAAPKPKQVTKAAAKQNTKED